MGIIGDAFGKLFKLIWDVVKWIYNGILKLVQVLINVIVQFFEALFALIAGLLYFLYMIGVLAVKLFIVLFEAGKILFSLTIGFGKTLASLSFSPGGGSGHGYSSMMGKVVGALKPMQLDPIAYILLFVIWFTTAISAMKLISSIRVGGD